MPEQLSQNQIDDLLNRLSTGVSPAGGNVEKIREYDFKSPKKFTKEQLKALDGLHGNFARMLSSYFSGLLRTYCEMDVIQIEEQSYHEYTNAITDTALLGIIDFLPKENKDGESFFIMEMSAAIGFLMIERLLGSSPGRAPVTPGRNYTDIEMAILNRVFTKSASLLSEAWNNYIESEVHLRGIETNPRMMQALSPDDTVVIVMLGIKAGELSGSLSMCIPAECLEEVADSFNQRYKRAVKKQDPLAESQKREMILEELTASDLPVTAVLDEFQMKLKDILRLQVSDVILLNRDIRSDIVVTVDQEPWFTAKLGESKLKKMVKLNASIAPQKRGL